MPVPFADGIAVAGIRYNMDSHRKWIRESTFYYRIWTPMYNLDPRLKSWTNW